MVDLDTLRLVQAVLAACVFVLVYFGTYRRLGSPFAGWWSGLVVGSGVSTGLYVVGDAAGIDALGPFGNGLSVSSAAMAWMAVRTLRDKSTPWWAWVAPGVVVAAVSTVESPHGEAWPGGLTLLLGMAAAMGLAAIELWAMLRSREARAHPEGLSDASAAIAAVAVASFAASAFYVARAIAYVAAGPASPLYQRALGPIATTLIVTMLLVVVTYSVAELARFELAHRWHLRAIRDDLTGLYLRNAFSDRARSELARVQRPGEQVALLVADLDHFKRVNDTHGHAAGDRVLVAFADAVRSVLPPEAFGGRWGGEEFIVLLPRADAEMASGVAAQLDLAFARAADGVIEWPTVSCGIAAGDGAEGLDAMVARADAALYIAKRDGRARTVVGEAAR